jgi:hypothetical protein
MGTKKGYDLIIDSQGYNLSENMPSGTWVPDTIEAELVASRDIPIIYDDLIGGCCYSERVMPNHIAWGKNIRTRDPRVVLPGPRLNAITLPVTAANLGQIRFIQSDGTNLLFGAGRYVIRATNGNPATIVEDADLGATMVARASVIFKHGTTRRMYIGGEGVRLRYRDVGSTGAWSTASAPGAGQASMKFDHMAVVYQVVAGHGAYRIVGSDYDTAGQIWSAQNDPSDPANWANAGTVEGGYAVRSMAHSNRHVYFVTDIGIFDLTDAGYSPNYTPYWKENPSSENGRAAIVYNGLVFATHSQGLDVVDPSGQRQDTSDWATPGTGMSNETPIAGQGTALTVDGGWLVYSQYNKSLRASSVCYGRLRSQFGIQGPGPMVWHCAEIYIEGERITATKVDSTFNGTPRLWIATVTVDANGDDQASATSTKLYWASIPKAATALQDWLHRDPADSLRHQFATSYELHLPAEDWGDGASQKIVMRYDVQADNLGVHNGVNKQIAVYAKNENEDTYTLQGTAGGSPRAVLYPPGEWKQGYRLQFCLQGSGDVDSPPILRVFKARVGKIAELREVRRYYVKLGGGEGTHGTVDKRRQSELFDHLVALQYRPPVQAVDEFDIERTMKIETGVQYVNIWDRRTEEMVREARFDATIITQVPETGEVIDTSEPDVDRYDTEIAWADTDGTTSDGSPVGEWQ